MGEEKCVSRLRPGRRKNLCVLLVTLMTTMTMTMVSAMSVMHSTGLSSCSQSGH